jgi:hypothetical protein
VTGAPTGATVSLAPTLLIGLGGLSSDLTVKVPRTTPAGAYTLTVTGTSGGSSRSVTVQLVKR